MLGHGWIDEEQNRLLPEWLLPLSTAVRKLRRGNLSQWPAPEEGGRRGAVLILFGDGESGHEVLLIARASDMRSHPGQPAFPGGAIDPQDSDAVAAALREAKEETQLNPDEVEVFGALPEIWLPPSRFQVVPVLAWWARPTTVAVGDPQEVAAVHRIPLSDLVNPDNRLRVRHPLGHVGPAFRTHGMLVWGFTGILLAGLLDAAGWSVPWNEDIVEELVLDSPRR